MTTKTKPEIKFGIYDSMAVRFSHDNGLEIWVFNGSRWLVPSRAMQIYCYECGVLTEQEYHRLFGDLPPLPPNAFTAA